MTQAAVLGQDKGARSVEDTIAHFRTILRGEVVEPNDPGYEQARLIHNAMIDVRPRVIARCSGTADVITAVNFARSNGLKVAVRGGGHHVAGFSVCEGGLVIDLSLMKGIRIDPEARTVRADAGFTWGELNRDLQVFGLGATGGYISVTGIGGLTLGGGFGWLVRKHGLALDNLISADVVTADGRLLRANHSENPDLFWGLRGGGGNFGIVTSFEFQAHPVGNVLAGPVIHPLENAGAAFRAYREYVKNAPEELTTGLLLFTIPAVPFLPPQAHGKKVAAFAVCWAGPPDEGQRALRPIREFGPPLLDGVQEMPYSAAQTSADFLWPKGMQNYWKSSFMPDLSDEAVETIIDNFQRVPSQHTVVVIDQLGGKIDKVNPDETAFSHRGWPYNFLITSAWGNRADEERNLRWTREFMQAMQPSLAQAVYVNYTSDHGDDLIRDAYTSQSRRRLIEVKRKYDPDNFFCMNQNIKPAV